MNDYLHRLDDGPEFVEIVQRKLQCLGLYAGECDGRIDEALREAIRRFQGANGLEQTNDIDQLAWDLLCHQGGYTFDEVLLAELASLRPRPDKSSFPRPQYGAYTGSAAGHAALTGLAFSSGGIRSATFNLGIVQALAEARMLHLFDYLSTVAGGGYIGGWLSRWIAEQPDGVQGVERKMVGTMAGGEPPQVKFLRQHSAAVTPEVRLLSAENWELLPTYIRNAVENVFVLSLGLAALLLLPRLWLRVVLDPYADVADVSLLVGFCALLVAVGGMARGVLLTAPAHPRQTREPGPGWLLSAIVLPLIIAAAAGSVVLWEYRDVASRLWASMRAGPLNLSAFLTDLTDESVFPRSLLLPGLLAVGLTYLVVIVVDSGLAHVRLHFKSRRTAVPHTISLGIWMRAATQLILALVTLTIGCMLTIAVAGAFDTVGEDQPHERLYLVYLAVFGMPLLLAIFGVALGVTGRLSLSRSGGWWSARGGSKMLLVLVLAWTALFLFSIVGPALVEWSAHEIRPWARKAIAAGWLGSAWASLWAAKQPEPTKASANRRLKLLALFGPPLVAATILIGVSTAVYEVLMPGPAIGSGNSLGEILDVQTISISLTPLATLFLALLLCSSLFIMFCVRADINRFSLWKLYRDRLAGIYLAAVNLHASSEQLTGSDKDDDIALTAIGGNAGKIQRPYHIVNSTVNLVSGGTPLVWQTRRLASFTFTPRFCGYEAPRMPAPGAGYREGESRRGLYRPTQYYGIQKHIVGREQGITLATAMAISGSASGANPNFQSSASLNMLMTLLNLRHGRWCGNPATRYAWKKARPRSGLFYLIKESLRFASESSEFLYVSDGGHFESLGIYELVRRRCRLIVAVDATGDPNMHFSALGNAIRKCSIDFNVPIEIDVKKIERAAAGGYSAAYCAAGKIGYSTVSPGSPDGTLLYIKPTLLGIESVDIYNYHKANTDFPHQSKLDQSLDDTEFETYRALGHYIGKTIFTRLAEDNPDVHVHIERLCATIEENWGYRR